MRAFVFPGQGGKVVEPEDQLLPVIRRVVGERIPEQVKVFARAARDADESRKLALRPDVVAGHSLGEYGAAYSAGCFGFETGLWLVARRDQFLAEAAEDRPGGMVAILKADPAEVEEVVGNSEGSVVANYNSPRQTVVSGLRGALGDAVSKIRGRAVQDSVEFRRPEVPVVSAIDGRVLETADAVREALKSQMVAPVRWVRVVETLARMRVEEWIELGGGGVLTRMLRDFELPSLKGMTFEDLRARLGFAGQAQSPPPHRDEVEGTS